MSCSCGGTEMKISDLIRRSWQVAESKGWHDRPRSFRTYETLFHTEVSEYAEEVRGNKDAEYENWEKALDRNGMTADISHWAKIKGEMEKKALRERSEER